MHFVLQINIGVFKKNENIHGDMRDLMEEFQSYVNDTETGDPIPVFSAGEIING